MIDTYILYIIIFLLSVVQSVAGVGLLVIGTPLFLLFGYNIIEIMFYLLPLSIITSIISLFFIKLKKKVEIKFKKKLFHYFFTICFPAMVIGLIILNNFSNLINFKIIVATIIILSIFIKIVVNLKNYKFDTNKLYIKIVIFFAGIVHGLTNSGGTLISIFLIKNEKKNLLSSICNIHWFYFFLAITQLLMLITLINKEAFIFFDQLNIYILPIIGAFIGIIIINNSYNLFVNSLIYFLAFISSLSLILF